MLYLIYFLPPPNDALFCYSGRDMSVVIPPHMLLIFLTVWMLYSCRRVPIFQVTSENLFPIENYPVTPTTIAYVFL